MVRYTVRREPADVVELSKLPLDIAFGLRAPGGLNRVPQPEETSWDHHMYATIRRYEAIDQTRTSELVKKVDETLVPRLSKLPGFSGYHLIEAGNGVMSSVGFFDTSAQADESTRVASNWVREEKLEKVLPNPPKITGGEVIVKEMNGAPRV
jgi:hypothetical protein